MKRIVMVAIALAALVGCSKENKGTEGDAATSASASASAAASSPSTTASAAASASSTLPGAGLVAATIPPPDRADRKAAREITKTNYKTELDSLEKEIGKD